MYFLIHDVAFQLTVNYKIHERVVDPPNTPDNKREPFFEVPNRRVRQFIGREDVLEKIEKGFSSGAGPRVVVYPVFRPSLRIKPSVLQFRNRSV
jgi:hypothetical protein